MIREDKWVLSRNQYAVNLASLKLGPAEPRFDGTLMAWCTIEAVWYRRKDGVLRACIGYLHEIVTPPVTDAREFLASFDHDPWGGHCDGRWDGDSYYSHDGSVPAVQAEHRTILEPMLASVPLIPPSYDGWWRFLTSKERNNARSPA